MNLSEENVLSILNPAIQYILPIYQRHYSWDNDNCSQLWNDIVKMQKGKRPGHFIGSIVNINDNTGTTPTGAKKFTLIDGQQRLATLTLILVALRDFARENPDKGIDAEQIQEWYLKNRFLRGTEQYKLLLTGGDRKILIDLVKGELPPKQNNDSLPRLVKNYNYFKSKIKFGELKPVEVFEAMGKLKIVNITLSYDDDPQAIFESLNSTGKDLSKSDLIRNFVLMGLKPEVMTTIYEKSWRPMEELFGNTENNTKLMDDFFKDYLTAQKREIPREDKIYEKFKAWYYEAISKTKIENVCNDIFQKARYYTGISFARHSNPELQSVYSEIQELDMQVSYPLLLKVHEDFDKDIIKESELIEILRLCISYIVRRKICDLDSRGLGKLFVKLINQLKQNNYVESLKQAFLGLKDKNRFPSDEEFYNKFMSCDIYGQRRCNYILGQLANFESKDKINPKNFTIEHIMPQDVNLSPEWQNELGSNWRTVQRIYLHTIGNLTLTKYNSEMSNKSFIEKRDMSGGFVQSGSKLNSFVCKQSHWNENIITERAKLLTKDALRIWPGLSKTATEKPTPPKQEEKIEPPQPIMEELFKILDKRIENLFPAMFERVVLKSYTAYKIYGKNYATVSQQKKRLKVIVEMKFQDVADPTGICRKSAKGKAEIYVTDEKEIDDVMRIIEQSLNHKMN